MKFGKLTLREIEFVQGMLLKTKAFIIKIEIKIEIEIEIEIKIKIKIKIVW